MEFLMTSIPESLLLIWEYTPSVLATTLFVLFFFLVINSFGLCPQSFPCFCHSLLFLLNQARKHRRTAHFPDRIILIRHGESLGNVDGNVYSSVCGVWSTLSPLGACFVFIRPVMMVCHHSNIMVVSSSKMENNGCMVEVISDSILATM